MEEKLYNIIAAKINNEDLSEEDLLLLKEWLEVSSENQYFFNKLEQWNIKHESFRKKGKLNHDKAWKQIIVKRRSILFRERYKMASRIAAIFVLFVGVALFMWYQVSIKDISIKDINGYNGVQLELADGKRIALDTFTESISINEAGVQLLYDTKVLSYKQMPGKQNNLNSLNYNKLTVPAGAEYHLILSDGTRVFMNASSELRYPTVFSNDSREVYLKGEAYFEVHSDSLRIFTVKTDNIDIQVLGTSFNVSAYEDMYLHTATLVSGKIRAIHGKNQYDLFPGEQICYDKEKKIVLKKEVDTCLYTSWKDGYYYFEAMRLEDIMQMISHWYGFKVFFQNSHLKDLEFSGRIQRYEDVERLFRKFEKTEGIYFEYLEHSVVIREK